MGTYAPLYTVSVPGRTLKYKATYQIPYFGLNSDILFGRKFQINMNAGYTPWASVKDRDDHLLRFKESTATADGFAFIANLKGSWNFFPHWFLIIGGEYLKIRTTGTQDQSFYGVPFFEVDDKITSKQWLVSVMITYRF
jgi:outer membrane protease